MRYTAAAAAAVCTVVALTGGVLSPDYEKFLDRVYEGTVPQATVDEVRGMIEDSETVYLLDTRAGEEYRVSRLEGARHVDFETFSPDEVSDIPEDGRIVVYCAVGYRSERVGEKLLEEGYSRVLNMRGGIFAWVNNGFPVYGDGGRTDRIHGYSRRWSRWLERGEVVYAP
jgi:rhodanese-related sulfurtransferase